LELVLGLGIAGIAVGMKLHRLLAEGGFQFDLGAGPGHFENFVIIAFGHRQPLANAFRPETGLRKSMQRKMTRADKTRDAMRACKPPPKQFRGRRNMQMRAASEMLTSCWSCRRSLP